MIAALRSALFRFLRIPPDPAPPAGSPESVRVFRASRNYYRYNLVLWGLKQAGAIVGIVFVLGLPFVWSEGRIDRLVEKAEKRIEEKAKEDGEAGDVIVRLRGLPIEKLVGFLEAIGFTVLLIQMPFTYALVRFDYELRFYIVTDRSLRIREGVTRIRERTMTFANIQNLTIEQGPLQRLLGIADLRVRTAGGGDSGQQEQGAGKHAHAESMHVGYFRGVDDAAGIRDVILSRLRRFRDSGLGDPDDHDDAEEHGPSAALADPAATDAAKRVLAEVRALRAALDRR